MSLFGNISMLSQAMNSFQEGLNIVSNNVANAATPGYSQEVLALNSLPTVNIDNLQLGEGDYATTIQRLHNVYLDNQLYLQLSDLGQANAEQTALQDLSSIFPEVTSPTATTGIQGALSNLETQWTALAAAPTSTTAETNVLKSLQNVAQLLNQDSQAVYNNTQNLDQSVQAQITQINGYVNQIASLNTQIVSIQSEGPMSNPNTLIDAREQAAEGLSKLIGANFRINSDGSMSVTINAGALVNEGQAFDLIGIPSQTNPGTTDVGYPVNTSDVYTDITDQITGGSLAGTIQVRDVYSKQVLLALNEVAYGLIQTSNNINETAISTSGVTDIPLFQGTNAMDIAVNPNLATNVSQIGGTRDPNNPGDVATMQAAQGQLLSYSFLESSPNRSPGVTPATIIDPTQPISSIIGNFAVTPGNPNAANPGSFTIMAGNNAVNVSWTGNESINQVIAAINAQGGGAIYATYNSSPYNAATNPQGQHMFIYADAPITAYDTSSSFLRAMQLSAVVTSAAPINNSPVSSYNQVDPTEPMNTNFSPPTSENLLNFYTKTDPPPAVGQDVMKLGVVNINWLPSDSLAQIFTAISTSNGTTTKQVISTLYNQPAAQIITFFDNGFTGANPPTLTPGTPMTSIAISDISGNLTSVLNLNTNGNSSSVFSQMIASLSQEQSTQSTLSTQAQNMVTQTQQLQNSVSQVNLNEETAQAQTYQYAYDASVELQQVMAQMLDVLINHTGSEVSSTQSFDTA